jgi:uncharacterized membrane protein
LGKTLIVIGLILVAAGIIVMFRDSIPLIRHLGRLPGDISVERGNFSFYFPVATSIVVSLVLSLILYLFGRLR